MPVNSITITQVEIVEWYDGFVSGIVYSSDSSAEVGVLVAYDTTSRSRIFALLPLSPALTVSHAAEIIRKMMMNGESIEAQNLASFDDVRIAYGFITEGVGVDVRKAIPAEIEEIKKISFPVIEYAVDPINRQKWEE